MFDAKSILEALVKGAAPQPQTTSQTTAGGGFGDILGQLTQMAQSAGVSVPQGAGAAGGIEDMLRKMLPHADGPGVSGGAPAASAGGGMGLPGGLGDILGKLQQAGAGAGGPGGSLMDVLGKVLAQATEGVQEGAGKIGAATGATDALGKAMGGQSGADILAKLKELAGQNQFGAGAAAGGLGAVVLGTHTGRTMAASAVKLGALALIGGLAYKAMLNYQNGKPLITTAHSVTEAAPAGTGFEPAAVTHETATLYIKAMIAAAAADGRVDKAEMERIMGAEKQAGLDADAEQFLANELNNPASIDDLADGCQSAEQAVQVYTAARIAVTPDGGAGDQFLAGLADRLGIDAKLAAQIDAAARSAA